MEDEQDDLERVEGRRGSSRHASTALFVGVVALVASVAVVGGAIGIGAVLLGIKALRQIRQSQGQLRGKGMAIGGIVLGGIAVPASLLALGLYLVFPLLMRARRQEQVTGTEEHMRVVLMACEEYAADDNDFLPPSLAPVVTMYSLPTKALRDVRNPAPPMTQPAVDPDYGKYEAEIVGHSDFVYVGDGLRLTMKGPARVMVLFAKTLVDGRRLIGFADGHVEQVPAEEWGSVLEATNEARVSRHRAPLPETLLNP
jgi:prepilin-type processing-associated H-X9-DG protein